MTFSPLTPATWTLSDDEAICIDHWLGWPLRTRALLDWEANCRGDCGEAMKPLGFLCSVKLAEAEISNRRG